MALATVNIDKIIKVTSASSYVEMTAGEKIQAGPSTTCPAKSLRYMYFLYCIASALPSMFCVLV